MIKIQEADLFDIQHGDVSVKKLYIGDTLYWDRASISDEQRFISAAGLTNQAEIDAVIYLVGELKSKGYWDRMIAIYPLLGGTAHSQKYNLKDPRDLDKAFRLKYEIPGTHTSIGITGGLVSTCINGSHINPDSFTVFIDIVSDRALALRYDFWMANNANLLSRANTNTISAGLFKAQPTTVWNYNSNARFLLSRSSSSDFKAYKNGTVIITTTELRDYTPVQSDVLYMFGMYPGNTSVSTTREYRSAFVCDGVSDAESTELDSIFNQFRIIAGK